jgi:hypothetical protein
MRSIPPPPTHTHACSENVAPAGSKAHPLPRLRRSRNDGVQGVLAPRTAVAGIIQGVLGRADPGAKLGSADFHGDNAQLRYRSLAPTMDWVPAAPEYDVNRVRAVCRVQCSSRSGVCVCGGGGGCVRLLQAGGCCGGVC